MGMIDIYEFLVNKNITGSYDKYNIYKMTYEGYSWYMVKINSEKELDNLIKNSGTKLSQPKELLRDRFFNDNIPLFINPDKSGGTIWQEDDTDVTKEKLNIQIYANQFTFDYWKKQNWK